MDNRRFQYTIPRFPERRWRAIIRTHMGYVIGGLSSIFGLGYGDPGCLTNNLLLDKTFDLSGLIGSFLLAVLSILLTMNGNPVLDQIKRFKFQWEQLMSYNIHTVILAYVLCLYSLALLGIIEKIPTYNIEVQRLMLAAFIFVAVSLLIKGIDFLVIFFRIAMQTGGRTA